MTASAAVDDVVAALDRDGFAVVEGMLSPQEAASARAELTRILASIPTGRNDFEGFKTRRIYALFAKTRLFDAPATPAACWRAETPQPYSAWGGGYLVSSPRVAQLICRKGRPMPEDLATDFLFDMSVDLEGGVDVGGTPLGRRVIFYVKGGTFEGPKLRGEVLPGGGDWALVSNDEATRLNVRLVLRTDDGDVIYMTYRGISYRPTDNSEPYFRTAPFFETASEKYSWLNRIVAIGVGRGQPTGVAYKVHAIL
jgi:hypothetical protein